MKKLLYSGLTALMMLLAFLGVSKAQEVTFSPAAGTVPSGSEITITKTGNGTIYYNLYSSIEDAQNDQVFSGDVWDAVDAGTIQTYSTSNKPVIENGKTVIRVGIYFLSWVKTDIYAQYTIGASGPTVTFSPDPTAGEVSVGQEITITMAGAQNGSSIYYNMYSSKADAQNDQVFTYTDDNFWDAVDTKQISQYNANAKPVIAEGKPVIRVGIRTISGEWAGSDFYAEYTIGEGETPGPDDPENKVETPTFSPAAGTVAPGTPVTISCNTEGASIYYTTDGSTPDENSTLYSTPIAINENTTIKAIATKDGMANSTVAEATYSLISISVTFSPNNGSVVQENADITITGTHNVAIGYFYWKSYASLEEAQAETWPVEYSQAGISILFNKGQTKTLQISSDKPVIKVGALYNRESWSEMFYAKYIVATKPVFSASGEVAAGTVVTISAFEGASIYYTTDETEPNASSTLYTTGITINEATTVKAIAIKDGVSSAVTTVTFTIAEGPITVEAPTFSHETGEVTKGTAITISCETNDAAIRYTTDGTDPIFTSTLYENPIIINQTTTVKAMAMKGGQTSSVVERTYTVKAEEPETVTLELDPANGEIKDSTEITITCSNINCDIIYAYYASREEAEADAAWTNYIDNGMSQDMFDYNYGRQKPKPTFGKNVLRVGAWLVDEDDYDKSSFVATAYAEYTIKEGGEEEPIVLTFTPASGAEVEEGAEVTITTSRELGEDEYIMFAMFATKEAANACSDDVMITEMAKFYGEPDPEDETIGRPIITKAAPVLKASYLSEMDEEGNWICNWIIAEYRVKEGENPDPDKVAAPVFSVPAGTVDSNSTVTISKGTADSIFVAFGKTAAEAVAFAKHTADVTVTIVKDTVIRAYAMKDGKYSDTISRAYTLRPAVTPDPDTVKTPTFSVTAGQVEKGTKVALATATEGAKIYYTINGDVPTAQSTEYTAEISIDSAMTIKAIAIKEGMVNSQVAEAAYTIKPVANEGAELAGVRLYPNPNNGEFNVSVPVRVQVEVFTVNGTLVKALTLAQGNTQLRLENSGIYFVRFTAENGQAAVKRVIVR